jgi:hypothetical protein
VLVSTPFWAKGDYYDIWERGEGWTRIEALPEQCTHLSKEYLDEMRQRLAPAVFAAEYENQWLTGQGGLIPHDLIMSAMSDNVENLDSIFDEALFESGLAEPIEDYVPTKKGKGWGDSWSSIGKTAARERTRKNESENEIDDIITQAEAEE